MDAYVEVIRPDGSAERHRIEGEQMTVGRSPSAGITVSGADELEPEHLLVAPRPDGVWVAIAKGARKATVRGQEFDHGLLAWGTEVDIGSIKLKLTDALPATKKEKKPGNPILILAFVAVPLVGWLLLSDPIGGLPEANVDPPASLFAELAACPDQGAAALNRARESAEAALAKSERYPFDSQDGVEAVGLYGVAESCYAASGYTTDAQRMHGERDVMKRRIEEDFLTHRLRLEQALHNERIPDALVETRALRAIVRHIEGPYADWLLQLERVLQLRVDQRVTQ